MGPIVVVGATGSVGRLVLKVLSEVGFPVRDVVALASADSVGKRLSYGEEEEVRCAHLGGYDFRDTPVAIFAAGSEVSARYVPEAVECGCVVIDGSSFFRMEEDVPLVVPEVNRDALAAYTRRNVVASPNCSTTQMLVALNPLHKMAKIKRIVASTYQSVSGVGKEAMSELYSQTKSMFMDMKVKSSEFPKQISFNCIPQVGELMSCGSTDEELKMSAETKKIMDDGVEVVATCVRVPVFVCHSQALHVEFHNSISREEACDVLREAPGVFVIDHHSDMMYATPVDCVDDDGVYVSRIREDKTVPHGLSMWVVSDNLRKGAALNLVQITKLLIDEYL